MINQSGKSLSLSNINFNGRGGYKSRDNEVRNAIVGAKNGKDLARLLNISGMGYNNWK